LCSILEGRFPLLPWRESMKFYGEPNLLVNTRKKVNGMYKNTPLFRFDKNGEYNTDDEKLINKLKPNFKYEKNYKCNKCNFETDNMGELLQHYKHKHPKEE
jgi:hypothetical protein